MSVSHPVSIRNAIADLVCDSVDVGGAGSLIFQTSGDVAVATLTFSATAFGAASSGTCTANAITSDTSAVGGTVAKFKIQNGSAADAGFAGAVSTSGSDINLSSLAVGSGDTVSISSLTYTAPA